MVRTQPGDWNSALTEVVAALQRAWSAIQTRHPDVPDVTLTIASGPLGLPTGHQQLGHLAADRWRQAGNAQAPELFIGADGLRHGPRAVFTILLHEAAHGMAHTRRIKDTSRGGRYHNARYKT